MGEMEEKRKASGEMLDVLDENRQKTGRLYERGTKMQGYGFVLLVQAWIRNSKGQYLLSQRHPAKEYFPLMWEATEGMAKAGETSQEAILREVQEELGICLDADNGRIVKTGRRDSHRYFYDVWLFDNDTAQEDVRPQDTEVAQAIWMTPDQIRELAVQEKLVPMIEYFEEIFQA